MRHAVALPARDRRSLPGLCVWRAQWDKYGIMIATNREYTLASAHAARLQAQASEQRYRVLAEALPEFICMCRLDGEVEYFNHHWYEYTGLAVEPSMGFGWLSAVHPDDRQGTLERWKNGISGGVAYEIEYRVLRAKDGSYRWHLGRLVPLRDPQGQIVKWLGATLDIDDRKRAEQKVIELNEELRRRVNELQTLLNVISISIGIAEDPRCERITVNPAFARWLGISPDANASLSAPLNERPTSFKVYRDGRELVPEELPMQYAASHAAPVADVEIDVVHRDGTRLKLLEYAAPLSTSAATCGAV
jgi:PAS domain S-box-containing protein